MGDHLLQGGQRLHLLAAVAHVGHSADTIGVVYVTGSGGGEWGRRGEGGEINNSFRMFLWWERHEIHERLWCMALE